MNNDTSIALPTKPFYAYVKPFNPGDPWLKVWISPDAYDGMLFGYQVHLREAGNAIPGKVKKAYFNKQQMKAMFYNGEYSLTNPEEIITQP